MDKYFPSVSGEGNILSLLRNVLMDNTKVKLNRGIGVLVDIFLQVSMLRPSQEQTIPQQSQKTVCLFSFRLAS